MLQHYVNLYAEFKKNAEKIFLFGTITHNFQFKQLEVNYTVYNPIPTIIRTLFPFSRSDQRFASLTTILSIRFSGLPISRIRSCPQKIFHPFFPAGLRMNIQRPSRDNILVKLRLRYLHKRISDFFVYGYICATGIYVCRL
jgi:hypothetical protein